MKQKEVEAGNQNAADCPSACPFGTLWPGSGRFKPPLLIIRGEIFGRGAIGALQREGTWTPVALHVGCGASCQPLLGRSWHGIPDVSVSPTARKRFESTQQGTICRERPTLSVTFERGYSIVSFGRICGLQGTRHNLILGLRLTLGSSKLVGVLSNFSWQHNYGVSYILCK
ncbi:hypothetical protein L209DRAFT_252783 [Thermothelomyces heterothallicus CBS 203.75]